MHRYKIVVWILHVYVDHQVCAFIGNFDLHLFNEEKMKEGWMCVSTMYDQGNREKRKKEAGTKEPLTIIVLVAFYFQSQLPQFRGFAFRTSN